MLGMLFLIPLVFAFLIWSSYRRNSRRVQRGDESFEPLGVQRRWET